jgi:DNA-binding winged helix-turn-helix (wHTH) protein
LTLYGSTANGINKSDKSEETNYQTPLRLIGHKLLLSSGDSKSRVMPIKQLLGDELEIYFENELSLEPDSVFNIISKTIKSSKLPDDYTTNVFECSGNEIVYSFVMSGNHKNVIVPCLGRTLPKGCYYINIKFSQEARSNRNYILLGCILLLILLAYLLNLYFRRNRNTVRENESTPIKEKIKIGEFLFCFDQRYLEIYGERIELTDKESKLLYIFALTPNEIIDREQLQKEVWENEGVIVTRSLDVFISKLRKKLEKDSSVKLVNVHGKGYKLEIPRS